MFSNDDESGFRQDLANASDGMSSLLQDSSKNQYFSQLKPPFMAESVNLAPVSCWPGSDGSGRQDGSFSVGRWKMTGGKLLGELTPPLALPPPPHPGCPRGGWFSARLAALSFYRSSPRAEEIHSRLGRFSHVRAHLDLLVSPVVRITPPFPGFTSRWRCALTSEEPRFVRSTVRAEQGYLSF